MHDQIVEQLPPYDEDTEKALVGCLILAGRDGSQAQVDAIIEGVSSRLFFCPAPREVFFLIQKMRKLGNVLDPITLLAQMKASDYPEPSRMEVFNWEKDVPSVVHWTFYRDLLAEFHKRRMVMKLAADASRMARDTTIDPTSLQMDVASILEGIVSENSAEQPRLVIRTAKERREYVPPVGLDLVGDCEIMKGMEGLAVLAGPGGSGKSLMLAGLCLAGSIGSGFWMGRKVHRKFKTLVIQGEVGPRRLSRTMQDFASKHPEADVDNHVFYSDPPPFGYSINDQRFWAELSKQVKRIQPDLFVIDPVSGLSVVDEANEVTEALRTIRQAAGTGENAASILLVAHTKKPRSEEAMRGRNMANMVSGSVAWVNASRVTYLCLPFDSEEMEDDRVYFATPKLNDGANYAPSVWKRRFGTFFEHDPNTDPRTWGKDKSDEERHEERRKIGRDDLEAAFGDRPGMKRNELVKALVGMGHDEATCYRATTANGYLMKHLNAVAGVVALK